MVDEDGGLSDVEGDGSTGVEESEKVITNDLTNKNGDKMS